MKKLNGSLQEKMKTMPRVKVEAGNQVVIETVKDGVLICEIICYVEQISYNMQDGSSEIELNCFDPNSTKRKVSSYAFDC